MPPWVDLVKFEPFYERSPWKVHAGRMVGRKRWPRDNASLLAAASRAQRIWKEAEFRAVSLQRAEEGKGDTLWTARVRRNTNKTDAMPDKE